MREYELHFGYESIGIDDVFRLWTALGWNTSSWESMQQTFDSIINSNFVVSAWTPDGDMIGLATAITDSLHTVITWFVIDKKWSDSGLNTKMMETLVANYPKCIISVI